RQWRPGRMRVPVRPVKTGHGGTHRGTRTSQDSMRAGTNPPVGGTGCLWAGFFGSPAGEFDGESGRFPGNWQKRNSNVPDSPGWVAGLSLSARLETSVRGNGPHAGPVAAGEEKR